MHVVAAVIDDGSGRVLIARRPDHLHQGGLWEFPGGKLEPDESPRSALVRELHEELGIEVKEARPLLRVRHAYPDRRVLLDVWRVSRFSGEAHGREGQPVRWVPAEQLPSFEFPAANLPIIAAARLPPLYLITPEPGPEEHWSDFLATLTARLRGGLSLVQLRARQLDPDQYGRLAVAVRDVCHAAGAKLILSAAPSLVVALSADGVHLTGERLRALRERPLGRDRWVAASCHDAADLEHAAEIGCDFAVLSPVQPTASHPEVPPLGWERFAELAEASVIPVYALGGVSVNDLPRAWQSGAQGVAAIRGLWDADSSLDFRRFL